MGLIGSAKGDTQNRPKLGPSIPIFQLKPPIHAANVTVCACVCAEGCREALLHHLPGVQGMQGALRPSM